jgi:hypothetical protein
MVDLELVASLRVADRLKLGSEGKQVARNYREVRQVLQKRVSVAKYDGRCVAFYVFFSFLLIALPYSNQ